MYNPSMIYSFDRKTWKTVAFGCCLLLQALLVPAAAWAQEVPAGPPEIPGLDSTLPLPDFGVDLPEPPSASSPSATAAPTPAPQAAPAVEPTAVPQPTATSTPTRKPSKPPRNATPTPTVTSTETPGETPIVESVPNGPARMRDFFPIEKGRVWEYQFVRMPGQTVGRKSRQVECLKVQEFPNGTVRGMMKTTVFAGGSYQDEITTDVFSIVGNAVVWLTRDGQPQTNRYLLKLPAVGATERWSWIDPDGTQVSFKADRTPLKTEERIYPECIVVVERSVKTGAEPRVRHLYYARGKGLVRLEVYGPDLKVDRAATIDLVEIPPTPTVTP